MHKERITCTEEEQLNCPLKRHIYDVHHRFFPKYLYMNTPLAQEFVELEENKEPMCYYKHHFIVHGEEEMIPPVPGVSTMLAAVMRIEE